MKKQKQVIEKLVWIDLETTGFYSYMHKIIQIGVLITDTNLNIIDEEGFTISVGIEKKDLDNMIEDAKQMHISNGLLDISLNTQTTIKQAQKEVLKYVSKFVEPKQSPLCGSNSSFDRRFIEYHMRELNEYLHYRNIDVSTTKQLNNLWGKEKYINPKGNHTAISDLKDSINELKYYKSNIFDKLK